MYERSSTHFLRTITGIKSGPGAFGKSRLVMPFLTNLGITEILCIFRLVLEGRAGKEIPDPSTIDFLDKFSAKDFTLPDAEKNTSGPLNRGGIVDIPRGGIVKLKTLLAISQKLFTNQVSEE